jgi:putative acetyltransferase
MEFPMSTQWLTRAENGADISTIREITVAAFPTEEEAGMIDALRSDPAWIDGLSVVATDGDGHVVAHALLTRCHVGGASSLMLGPVSVLPEFQRQGAGAAVTRAVLDEARRQGEPHVVVVGWPDYYPRFGFERASIHGISVSIDAPDEAVMVLKLDPSRPLPSGVVRFAAGFGL